VLNSVIVEEFVPSGISLDSLLGINFVILDETRKNEDVLLECI